MLKEDVVCKAARSLGLRVKKVHRRISMEEFNERWSNLRLCMFCGEEETPYHHLQHKNEVILMIECDDDQTFDDKEETHQVHETLTDPAPIEEDVSSDQICDEKELVSIELDLQEVQTKTVVEEKLNLPNGQNIEHLVGKNFETFSTEYSSFLNLSSSNGYQKDSTWIESSLYRLCSLKDGRVWETGGLPNTMDLWDWPETELKPCEESQQVETFLYSLMQVVKRNLEFKTFESNKTFSLEDEQDDEPEQNQVIKLISLWNNHIWEPGGVLIEHDKWNWLEKCYNRGRLMRLMHWMSSMWWKEIKSRKSDGLSACSCVNIKTWHCVKHETQQTDFHVWHRWKNKAEKLPEDYAFLEFMMLGLVSLQSNKRNGLVGLVPKAIRVMLVGRFSGGGIKEVSLGCLGIHNMKLKEEVDICFRTHHNLRCLITHSVLETTKLHEISSLMSLQKNAEMTSPLAKETQGWIVNTWCMIQVFSDFDIVSWIGLEICGCETKKHMLLLMKLANRVWDRGELLATHVYRKWLENCYKHKWRSRLSHSFSEMKQRMIVSVWKSFGYLMEDMMEEDQKLQGDSEPLLTVPDFAAKICETLDQYIRKKGYVSADRESESNQPTLRFSTWVTEIFLNHYIILLLTPVAYAIHFLGGVGMDKKQSHLSLWINRVWDPGRSLVKDASYSTRIFSSLPATVPVSLLCQESFAYQITSFSLEVKVSLKGEDLLQIIWVTLDLRFGLSVCRWASLKILKLRRIKGRRRSDLGKIIDHFVKLSSRTLFLLEFSLRTS